MSNKHVIAIFVIGIGLLLGAFWAGLYVVKQDASANPSQSHVTSQSAANNPGTAPATKSAPANANSQTQSQPQSQQPSSSDTRYIVQVGASFGTVEKANELTAQLKKKYLGAHTQNPTGGDTLYRVRIGPYDRRDDAQQVANELSSQGFKGVMIFPWTGN